MISVFISYRRDDGIWLAKYILDKLSALGFDVFMDLVSLGAGEFEPTILAEIAERDYFLLVLTSGSLNRMIHQDDWLRRELTRAIETGRTVVPVLAEGVEFRDPQVQRVISKLPKSLRNLPSYNAVRIHSPEYFDNAM